LPKKHEPPLLVELKQSRKLIQFLVVIHVLALAASIANALPVIVKSVLFIGICIHHWFTLKRVNEQHYKIRHTEGLGWELADGNDVEAIEIINSTVITTFAIFLHFKNNAKKQSLLILNDALSDDEYRRLIVRLKTASNT
jgi:toxin CptA